MLSCAYFCTATVVPSYVIGLANGARDVIFSTNKNIMNKGIQHNEDEGDMKRSLTTQLDTARQNVLDTRAKWKQDGTDTNRFALQTALSVETHLDKLLWKFD